MTPELAGLTCGNTRTMVTRVASVKVFRASIRIGGEGLNPDEITGRLGCQPTLAYSKGDPGPRMKTAEGQLVRVPRPIGFWSLDDDASRFRSLEELIGSLLDRTTADIAIWRGIASQYHADVFCGVFLHEYNEGFSISADLSRRIGERGLLIDFDVYADLDEEDPNAIHDWPG